MTQITLIYYDLISVSLRKSASELFWLVQVRHYCSHLNYHESSSNRIWVNKSLD